MLHAVSWAAFGGAALTLTILYYSVIIIAFYRKKIRAFIRNRWKAFFVGLPAGLALQLSLSAQDGKQGITQANELIRGYFDVGTQLMYGVGAIVGLIGAIKVYQSWNNSHGQEAWRAAAAWFGSCIFLVVVATVIKSFFGL